jgi:chromate transporter
LVARRDVVGGAMLVVVFIAIGVVRLPLAAVLLAAIPLSVVVTLLMQREGSA